MTEVTLHELVHDAGSVVVFKGTVSDERDPGRETFITVDHRYARAIVDQLEADGDVIVDVEDWQLS